MEALIKTLGIPGTIGAGLLAAWVILQFIGELCELMGKVVPEFMKIRKVFIRKREEKRKQQQLLADVKTALDEMNRHYDPENIRHRNEWMGCVDQDREWMHQRAIAYDDSIALITESLNNAAENLKENTKMTEELFIENSRDRIIDFAEKASNFNYKLSREQFRRIDKVYNKYEEFLAERHLQNGEVDFAWNMIQKGYEHRMLNRLFVEDQQDD